MVITKSISLLGVTTLAVCSLCYAIFSPAALADKPVDDSGNGNSCGLGNFSDSCIKDKSTTPATDAGGISIGVSSPPPPATTDPAPPVSTTTEEPYVAPYIPPVPTPNIPAVPMSTKIPEPNMVIGLVLIGGIVVASERKKKQQQD